MDPEKQAVDYALLERDVKELTRKVEELTSQVAGLVNAWQTATGVLVFIKGVAKIGAALAFLYGALKGISVVAK